MALDPENFAPSLFDSVVYLPVVIIIERLVLVIPPSFSTPKYSGKSCTIAKLKSITRNLLDMVV